MTGLNIYRSSNPQDMGGKVLPMSNEDAEFWRLRRGEEKPRRHHRLLLAALGLGLALTATAALQLAPAMEMNDGR